MPPAECGDEGEGRQAGQGKCWVVIHLGKSHESLGKRTGRVRQWSEDPCRR